MFKSFRLAKFHKSLEIHCRYRLKYRALTENWYVIWKKNLLLPKLLRWNISDCLRLKWECINKLLTQNFKLKPTEMLIFHLFILILNFFHFHYYRNSIASSTIHIPVNAGFGVYISKCLCRNVMADAGQVS